MIIVLSSLIVVPLIGGKLMYDQQHESLPCKLFWMVLQPPLRTKMMRSCPRKLKGPFLYSPIFMDGFCYEIGSQGPDEELISISVVLATSTFAGTQCATSSS